MFGFKPTPLPPKASLPPEPLKPRMNWVWPDTGPPPDAGHTGYRDGMSDWNKDGNVYVRTQIQGDHWRWVIDPERTQQRKDALQKELRRQELVMLMRRRILTTQEMNEVIEWGLNLVWKRPTVRYASSGQCSTESLDELNASRQLNDLFFQQAKLRSLRSKSRAKTDIHIGEPSGDSEK